MARALRSSGASGTSATTSPPPSDTRTRALKRKRTGEDDQSSKQSVRREETDSASPLTDLAPSPAVKDETDDNGEGLNGNEHPVDAEKDLSPAARSPTPGLFVDGCDQPPSTTDAHKLLTVLEMFDTQSLLARHVPPADTTLRTMLKNPTHSIRSIRAAITSLLPTLPHSRARLSLEQTAQRSFCELALGLLDEVAQKQPLSKERVSVFQISAEHKSNKSDDPKPTRYALQQTIYGTDYYTNLGADSLTPEKAASLATGQASLTAIIPAVPIPASAMSKLGAYSRKPINYYSPWLSHDSNHPAMLDLSYGPRCSFAPTYESSGSPFTRSEVDSIVARRIRKSKLYGPPPPLPPPLPVDAEMTDAPKAKKAESTPHPDLVPALDPSLGSTSPSTSPSTPKIASTLDPSLDPELCNALDTAFQELALEDSVRGLLQSNARAMTRLVDLQNERFQKWDLRKPNPEILDVKEGEELELARCIEKTLGMLTALRPRTLLSSVSSGSEPTSLIPPASVLRALHRTLPTEPSPGYRGTLDPRREMSLRDDTTIKMANLPPPAPAPVPAPTPVAAGTPRPGVPATPIAAGARPAYPTTTGSGYYGQQTYPQAGQYPQQGAYPQGQYAGYQQPQQGQYPVQYPAGAAGTQPVQQYPQTPAAGQQYPYGYTYPGGQYPTPAAGAYTPATPGQPGTYPVPTPGQPAAYNPQVQPTVYPQAQGTAYPTPAQGAAYPVPTPAAGTPRVITNMVKTTTAAPTGVWSPGQGYTPTTATPTTGYNPAVVAQGQYPAVGAQGQYPAPTGQAQYPTPAAGQTQYPTTVGQTQYPTTVGQTQYPTTATTGYNYPTGVAGAYTPTATGYTPSPTAYAPTPVKPGPLARGAIPPHVRSTPGTPASPSSFLPAQGAYPSPTPWNGGQTPSTPRPAA